MFSRLKFSVIRFALVAAGRSSNPGFRAIQKIGRIYDSHGGVQGIPEMTLYGQQLYPRRISPCR
jgi:hypothetical protein